jgi:two-component system OmpR family response regulator
VNTPALLSLLIFTPWVGALLLFVLRRRLPDGLSRTLPVVFSLSTLVLGVFALGRFEPAVTGMQLVENHPWITALNVHYHLGLDGLSLVRNLRDEGLQIPVLMLTTMSGLDDRVEGLTGGADDYLAKPFAFAELLARVHAITRRADSQDSGEVTRLRLAGLEVDLIRRSVQRDGKVIELQPQEFRLLEFLMRNAGRVVTRTMLLEHVWDLHFDPRTNIVETHLSRLRAKVDRGFEPELIHTLRGVGYILRAD